MWASVALLTTLELAPMPVHQLQITNDRVTHGELGWDRKDQKTPKLLPGDIFIVVFDITGLVTEADGRIKYSMGMELKDKTKVVFSKAPEDLEATASLGGKRLAASAQTVIGTDTAPGLYTMKVTVTDRGTKNNDKVELTRTFEVLPVALGLTRLIVTQNAVLPDRPVYIPTPPLGVPGQVWVVNFCPVGFALDEKKRQPNVSVEMRILDDAGKLVVEPFRGGAIEVQEQYKKIIPMQFMLSLNRPGKFRIQLKVTDNVTKKTAEEVLDFSVLGQK